MSMTELDKKMKESENRARRAFVTRRLNQNGMYPRDDTSLAELENMYVNMLNKVAKAHEEKE